MDNKLRLIQQKELKMLKVFHDICEEHGFVYYAIGGTLLGAVRHQGFIPWDDDIDVGMPREDYEKFKALCDKAVLPYPYRCVHEKNDVSYTKAFAKIQDVSTRILMKDSAIAKEESLWIDIFPLDGLPANKLKQIYHKFRYLYTRMMVQLSQFNYIVNQSKENRPIHEKVIIALAKIFRVEKWLSYEKRQKKYIDTIKKYSVDEKYMGNYTGAYKLKELVPSSYFKEAKSLLFEDMYIKVPNQYENYLTAIYGANYMQLPPKEQQKQHNYEIMYLEQD